MTGEHKSFIKNMKQTIDKYQIKKDMYLKSSTVL